MGGAPYLHTLISTVPTAANAPYYAETVSDMSAYRRIVEAGLRIVQLGYAGARGQGGDVGETITRAQDAVLGINSDRIRTDYQLIGSLVQPGLDEIEAIGKGGGPIDGVKTGFYLLDSMLGGGLRPGQFVIMAGRPAMGKSTGAIDVARARARSTRASPR